MSRFIKLTNLVINTNAIKYISSKENVFYITLKSSDFSGFLFAGSGTIGTDNDIIKVSNVQDSTDYQTIKKWIDSI